MSLHSAHCCKRCGCKYGFGNECDVVNGTEPQDYPCEDCATHFQNAKQMFQALTIEEKTQIVEEFMPKKKGDKMAEKAKVKTAKLLTYTPAGLLIAQGRTYFMIANRDNSRDTWEMCGGRYFVVPCRQAVNKRDSDNGEPIYFWARHLTVFGGCLIEWGSPVPKIQCIPAPTTLVEAESWVE